MSKDSQLFLEKMLEFLPDTRDSYNQEIEYHGEILETVLIEDVFLPQIIDLLRKDEDKELLKRIFIYFEQVSNCNDEHLINIFSITVLEVLGNEKAILKKAQVYMGPKTKQLQIEADKGLGRYD